MRFFILLSIYSLAIACGNGNNKTETQEPAPVKKDYFSVADYIKGEINTIDSLPVGILKKTIKASKKDSAFIERQEFRALARVFTDPALEKAALEAKYAEHSFMDQTTGYYTFTYEPTASDAPYQRIDVLVRPGETYSKVKSIYMAKSSSQNDTTINERFYWKANNSFSITKEKVYKNQTPVVDQLMVIWDPSAY